MIIGNRAANNRQRPGIENAATVTRSSVCDREVRNQCRLARLNVEDPTCVVAADRQAVVCGPVNRQVLV